MHCFADNKFADATEKRLDLCCGHSQFVQTEAAHPLAAQL
jgi:hypothetical protein